MKKSILLLLFFCANYMNAQDSLKVAEPKKTNPIVFADLDISFRGAESAGWGIGASVNYQFFKTDLLTARIRGFASYESEYVLLAPTVAFPVLRKNESIVDYGILYGKRWIAGGTSFSISAGVAAIHYEYSEKIGEDYFIRRENLVGIPYEFNVKFFKKVKRRYRAYYWLIPTGKEKVAFGRNFGFKLSGNISKANYLTFGFSFGLGTHKKY